jgi:hypothetical protein
MLDIRLIVDKFANNGNVSPPPTPLFPPSYPRLVMFNRILIPMLFAAALAFACGPWSRSAQTSEVATPQRVHATTTSANVVSTFDVMVDKQHKNHVAFALRVTNGTKKQIELRFPTGQTHDFVVTDTLGREVWRWSKGRLFTSSLQNKLVKSNDTASYVDTWNARNLHGKFVAIARLESLNHPVEQRVAFTIE